MGYEGIKEETQSKQPILMKGHVLVGVLQRNRTNRVWVCVCVCVCWCVGGMVFFYRNCLTQLWKLRSPLACCLQAENQESQWNTSKSKGPRTKSASVGGQEKMGVPAQKESEFTLFALHRPSVGWIMTTHIGEGNPLSLPIKY